MFELGMDGPITSALPYTESEDVLSDNLRKYAQICQPNNAQHSVDYFLPYSAHKKQQN